MYLGVCEAISCNFVSELTTISFFLFVKFETRKRNYPTSSVVMKLQETFQILTIIVISSLSSMHSIIPRDNKFNLNFRFWTNPTEFPRILPVKVPKCLFTFLLRSRVSQTFRRNGSKYVTIYFHENWIYFIVVHM